MPIRAGITHRRLREGLEQDIDLIQAKCIIGLMDAGAETGQIVREVALFGVANRDDWASGLTSLAALANLTPRLSRETAYLRSVKAPGAWPRIAPGNRRDASGGRWKQRRSIWRP